MIPGNQWVLMQNGTRKQIKDLVYNDEIYTDDGVGVVQGIIVRFNDKYLMM